MLGSAPAGIAEGEWQSTPCCRPGNLQPRSRTGSHDAFGSRPLRDGSTLRTILKRDTYKHVRVDKDVLAALAARLEANRSAYKRKPLRVVTPAGSVAVSRERLAAIAQALEASAKILRIVF